MKLITYSVCIEQDGGWKVKKLLTNCYYTENLLVSRNSLEVCNVRFLICLFKSPSTQVATARMLFLPFNFDVNLCWYFKKRDPRSCPGSIALKDWVIFHAGFGGLGSNDFRNSVFKEKTAGSARVSRLSFRFLWLCLKQASPDDFLAETAIWS